MGVEPEAGESAGRELRQEVVALAARVAALEEQMLWLRSRTLPEDAARQPMEPADRITAPPPPLLAAAEAAALSAPPRAAVPAGRRRQTARGSLEDRIGAQLFNRIGVIALLLGAAWALKLAIANGLIGPVGRVLLGLLAGAGLVWWSERFRRGGFAAFSYSLKALGSSLLYLTLWAAFQLYGLMPASIALIAMLLVTAWNGYLAWAQDAELLAAYAFAGALATPALLSTGGNHEVFLFTYLLAIDLACAVLVTLKRWPRLLLGVFPATMTFFIGWYSRFYAPAELAVTIVFTLLLYAAFLLAVFPAWTLGARQSSSSRIPGDSSGEGPAEWTSRITQILLPLADAAFLALAMYSVLEDAGYHALLPWLMVSLAALYLGLVRLPQRSVTADVHLSLAIAFLTIAIPLKLSGSWMTVAWFVEGVALLWVALRQTQPAGAAHSGLLRLLAVGALLLGVGGALWRILIASETGFVAFGSPRFWTAMAGLFALAGAAALSLRASKTELPERRPTSREIAAGSIIVFNLLALLAVIKELGALWQTAPRQVVDPELGLKRALAISAFLMLYGAALLAVGFWKRSAFVRWQGLLLVIATIAKTFLWDVRDLSQGYRIASFLGLGALLMAISFAYQRDWLGLRPEAEEAVPPTGSSA